MGMRGFPFVCNSFDFREVLGFKCIIEAGYCIACCILSDCLIYASSGLVYQNLNWLMDFLSPMYGSLYNIMYKPSSSISILRLSYFFISCMTKLNF